MERIKVIHTKAKLSSDGATVVLLNMATELKDKVQFDFLLYMEEGNDWAWKFEELGSKIYYREAKKSNPILRGFERIKLYNRFFKEHHYQIVHIDTDSLERLDVLFCAWLQRINKRIYHSHNSKSESKGRLSKVPGYRRLLKFLIVRFATDLVACSKEAAKWIFPNRKLGDVKFIKNGIYTEKFRYNSVSRKVIRSQYGLDNCLVIGCVARFVEQKNHIFLINVFAEIVKENRNARLLLIGEGPLKGDIKKTAADLQLNDKVLFVGTTDKVEEYMCAMDLYMMPSLFEGLGLVFIEAQDSGLYCIASDAVSREASVGNRMSFFPLSEDAKTWKERIFAEKIWHEPFAREDAWKAVVDAGFDIRDASQKLLKIYQS